MPDKNKKRKDTVCPKCGAVNSLYIENIDSEYIKCKKCDFTKYVPLEGRKFVREN